MKRKKQDIQRCKNKQHTICPICEECIECFECECDLDECDGLKILYN